MKQRFSALDIRYVSQELQVLIGTRLQNIYELSPKIYLFKFYTADSKYYLIIESGIRIYLTEYQRDKDKYAGPDSIPQRPGYQSPFLLKLKQYLKGKRLTGLTQCGYDRNIQMSFGFGELQYFLYSEYFASGNIVLTDKDSLIIFLLRNVELSDENSNSLVSLKAGLPYSLSKIQTLTHLSPELVLEYILNPSTSKASSLKNTLATLPGLNSALATHWILSTVPQLLSKNIHGLFLENKSLPNYGLNPLLEYVSQVNEILAYSSYPQTTGYIVTKLAVDASDRSYRASNGSGSKPHLVSHSFDLASKYGFEDFQPILLRQFQNSGTFVEFTSFNGAIDCYFSYFENEKFSNKIKNKEEQTNKIISSVESGISHRIQSLEQVQEEDLQKATLIEYNIEKVQQAITVTQLSLSSGMDWIQFESLIEKEKQKANPVALLFVGLKFITNQITLRLSGVKQQEEDEDMHSDGEIGAPGEIITKDVDVDISLTAFANAKKYYDKKRKFLEKQIKTEAHRKTAIKSTLKKLNLSENSGGNLDSKALSSIQLVQLRKLNWWEKFYWFISSDNYLIIAGRDKNQNEILVKRYLGKDDLYVHAEIHGAASVIIKNNGGSPSSHLGTNIPLSTLLEAGCMSLCYSKAWESKVVTSAYWVYAEQVSKTPPTGQYLGSGSFIIRGKKNFLPHSSLVYGFGILFKLSDESLPNHPPQERQSTTISSSSLDAYNNETNMAKIRSSVESFIDHTSSNARRGAFDDDEALGENSNELTIQRKKRLSAKQKRDLKNPNKGPSTTPDEVDQLKEKLENTFIEPLQPSTSVSHEPSSSDLFNKAQPHVRGKKGKLKLLKTKYKDQDEEEKLLKMSLLNPTNNNSGDAVNKKPSVISFQTPLFSNNNNNSGINDSKVEPKKEPTTKSNSKDEKLSEIEENLEGLLNSFIGNPLAEDKLLYAIPICGPYSIIKNYKFNIKLIPGSLKKGSASKLAISHFFNQKTVLAQEKLLIKNINMNEVINCIPSHVKIVFSDDNNKKV